MAHPLSRWIVSLLAGALIGYVTWLLSSLALQYALVGKADIVATGLRWVLREGIPHAAAGVAFVYTAARLAPRHPLRALVAFVGFALILFVLVLFGVLAVPTGRLWIGPIAALFGAGVTSTILRYSDMRRP